MVSWASCSLELSMDVETKCVISSASFLMGEMDCIDQKSSPLFLRFNVSPRQLLPIDKLSHIFSDAFLLSPSALRMEMFWPKISFSEYPVSATNLGLTYSIVDRVSVMTTASALCSKALESLRMVDSACNLRCA